jgi:hypothetical protein
VPCIRSGLTIDADAARVLVRCSGDEPWSKALVAAPRSLNGCAGHKRVYARLRRAFGPRMTPRTALYEAANVLLSRITRFSKLKRWGMDVAKRRGSKRARVALARRCSNGGGVKKLKARDEFVAFAEELLKTNFEICSQRNASQVIGMEMIACTSSCPISATCRVPRLLNSARHARLSRQVAIWGDPSTVPRRQPRPSTGP